MSDNAQALVAVSVIGVIVFMTVFVVLCLPFALIWSLNTLFGAGIDVTLETWLAALFVLLVFAPKSPIVKIKRNAE